MQTLRDRAHDQVLHLMPPIDDLEVPDTDDVIAEKGQLCVVRDVFLALRADVVAAVDLQRQTVTEKEVHSVTADPHLRDDGQAKPAKSWRDETLEP